MHPRGSSNKGILALVPPISLEPLMESLFLCPEYLNKNLRHRARGSQRTESQPIPSQGVFTLESMEPCAEILIPRSRQRFCVEVLAISEVPWERDGNHIPTVPAQSASTCPDCPSTVGGALGSPGLSAFPDLSRTLGIPIDDQPDCPRTVGDLCARLS